MTAAIALVLLQVSLREGATQPPPRLFERDLIAAMERYGIGTDATVAGAQLGHQIAWGSEYLAVLVLL